MDDFDRCWNFVQKWEGGATIVKDPNDPGGTTKWGISQHAHPNIDIQNLTEEQAQEIVIQEYWKPVGADKLTWPKNLVAFDTAFNLGVKHALSLRQDQWETTLLERIFYYTRLVRQNPVLKTYLSGWLNRCYDLYKEGTR